MGAHLKELVWLPHPCWQALERDVYRGDRLAAKELRLVAFEHGQRDAEQDVKSIEEEDVPHAEKRLPNNNNNNERQHTTSAHAHTGAARAYVPRRGGSR